MNTIFIRVHGCRHSEGNDEEVINITDCKRFYRYDRNIKFDDGHVLSLYSNVDRDYIYDQIIEILKHPPKTPINGISFYELYVEHLAKKQQIVIEKEG